MKKNYLLFLFVISLASTICFSETLYDKTASAAAENKGLMPPENTLQKYTSRGQWLLEVPSERTRISSTYKIMNSDNTFSEEYISILHQKSLHYKKDGKWEKIDPTLEKIPGGWKTKDNDLSVKFTNYNTDWPFSISRKGEYTLKQKEFAIGYYDDKFNILETFKSSNALLESDSNSIIYPEVFPGINIKYTSDHDYVKKDVIIRQSAKEKLLDEISNFDQEGWLTLGTRIDFSENNGWYIDMQEGEEKRGPIHIRKGESANDQLSRGIIYDESGNRIIAKYKLIDDNRYGKLLLTMIPLEWVKKSNGDITIDPTYYATSADGYFHFVNETYSNVRDGSTGDRGCYDTFDYVCAGQHENTGSSGYTIYRGYYEFNTTGIPDDATITEARIFLNEELVSNDYDFNVSIYHYNWSSPLCNSQYSNWVGAYGASASFEGILVDTADGWTGDTWKNISLNTSRINPGDYTRYSIVSEEDVNNNVPPDNTEAWVCPNSADTAGTTEDPYLSITYTTPTYVTGWHNWTSETIDGGSSQYRPNILKASWTLDGSDNITPKFQVLGSDTGSFSGEESVYPGSGEYYQDGTSYDINNNVALDISSDINASYRYWKVRVSITTGTDTGDTPRVEEIVLEDSKSLTLQSSGQRVGIGTTSPLSIFHVNGNSLFVGDVNITGTLYGGSPVKVGGGLNMTSGGLYFSDGSSMNSAPAGGLWTNSSHDATYTDGNVGIGTSSPDDQLDVDPSTPDGISEISKGGSIPNMGYPWGLHVVGDYAYVVSPTYQSLSIIDISDPENPLGLSELTSSDLGIDFRAHDIFVSSGYAYCSLQDSGLAVIDISNPLTPYLVGLVNSSDPDISSFDSTYTFYVSGKYAYLGDTTYDNGFHGAFGVVDISDPSNPDAIAMVNSSDSNITHMKLPQKIKVSGGYAYVVSGGYGGGSLAIINITDPAQPDAVSEIINGTDPDCPNWGSLYNLDIRGNLAYVVDRYNVGGLSVVDISDKSNPDCIGYVNTSDPDFSLTYCEAGYPVGDFYYMVGRNGVALIDISDPMNPDVVDQLLGSNDPNVSLNQPQDIQVVGNYAYTVNYQGHSFSVIKLDGANIPTANIGSINSDTLNVMENLHVSGDIYSYGIHSKDGLFTGDLASSGDIYAVGDITAGGSCCADYVFEDNYSLMSLEELEKFVNENKHLPGISCDDSVSLSRQEKLVEKIEELTLYTFEQERKIKEQKQEIEDMKNRLEKLETTIQDP